MQADEFVDAFVVGIERRERWASRWPLSSRAWRNRPVAWAQSARPIKRTSAEEPEAAFHQIEIGCHLARPRRRGH
jgi:hypothetical protein